MRRVKAVFEYDGTNYYGWQLQKGQRTIQGEIEQALKIIFKKRIPVTGSGRTDTGVHARNQVAHFDIPETNLNILKRSLNGLLASDIVVKSLEFCAPDFHARFDAKKRLYRYYISPQPTALNRNFAWVVWQPLNWTLMQVGAERIKPVQDFRAFCKVKSEVKHHRCLILESRWLRKEDLLVYEITADRFLHGMVRAIVGTLVALGSGKITLAEMERIIDSGDRRLVPQTAPARGLVLEKVEY
ncbi:MAG TPA: tRNA pseudouridine(38-40) synthase TruA [Caldithrix abyssi]|uniref:tRNA pseudouridine synthase A n=1 Tax=Caldithrix abyssi TaxID=187145 RepID=A0A7V5H3K2_CALAY|nr:tRNA pseudouridine(38-40) synthase TruA [Caldithrix abyssi]